MFVRRTLSSLWHPRSRASDKIGRQADRKEALLMIVYKYLHPDRIDVLENGMIRFSQPRDLNDPFETNISDLEYRREIRRKQADENRRRFAALGASADVADAILDDLHDNVFPAQNRQRTDA